MPAHPVAVSLYTDCVEGKQIYLGGNCIFTNEIQLPFAPDIITVYLTTTMLRTKSPGLIKIYKLKVLKFKYTKMYNR